MSQPVGRRTDVLLRCSFWLAVAAFVVDVLEPGLVGRPSLQVGGPDDDPSLVIHWIPTALVAWMIVSSQLRKMGRKARFGRARRSSDYSRQPDKA